MKKFFFMSLMFLLFAVPSLSHANLIQNGSFENSGVWASSNVDWWAGWPAKDGSVSIDLSGGSAGSISQSFSTTMGERYQVSFWLSGNTDGGPALKTGYASAGNVSNWTFSFDTTNYNIHNDSTAAAWTFQSFVFTANSPNTTILTFQSTTDTPYGPVIDLVSVERAASVPLPATLLLFGPGLVGLAAVKRRFKK